MRLSLNQEVFIPIIVNKENKIVGSGVFHIIPSEHS